MGPAKASRSYWTHWREAKMSDPATPSTDSDCPVKPLQGIKDEYVHNPRDDWCTENDLVEMGYRGEALADLFGKPVPGHDGVYGWASALVAKIEETQLAPAYELLQSAFGVFNDAADTMTNRVFYSSLDPGRLSNPGPDHA